MYYNGNVVRLENLRWPLCGIDILLFRKVTVVTWEDFISLRDHCNSTMHILTYTGKETAQWTVWTLLGDILLSGLNLERARVVFQRCHHTRNRTHISQYSKSKSVPLIKTPLFKERSNFFLFTVLYPNAKKKRFLKKWIVANTADLLLLQTILLVDSRIWVDVPLIY